jgi:hypothetical protein
LRFYHVSRAPFLCWRKPGDDKITGDRLGIPVPPPPPYPLRVTPSGEMCVAVNPGYNISFWIVVLLVTLTGLTINLVTRTRKFGPDVGVLDMSAYAIYSLSVGLSL